MVPADGATHHASRASRQRSKVRLSRIDTEYTGRDSRETRVLHAASGRCGPRASREVEGAASQVPCRSRPVDVDAARVGRGGDDGAALVAGVARRDGGHVLRAERGEPAAAGRVVNIGGPLHPADEHAVAARRPRRAEGDHLCAAGGRGEALPAGRRKRRGVRERAPTAPSRCSAARRGVALPPVWLHHEGIARAGHIAPSVVMTSVVEKVSNVINYIIWPQVLLSFFAL